MSISEYSVTRKPDAVIGDAQLFLGDCLSILPTLGPVDAVVTSPPYNQLGSRIPEQPTGMWGRVGGGRGFVEAVNSNGYADDMDEAEYQAWQMRVFAAVPCQPTASLFYNHQVRWRDRTVLHPIEWFKPIGWSLRQEIVWDRTGGMMMNARMFCRHDERILWFVRGPSWKWNQDHVGMGTVWTIPHEQNKPHPVAFPIKIPTRCIGAATDARDTILDPFMGSGTTGVACANLGRCFIGIEIEPRYFDIACERIRRAYEQPRLPGLEPESVVQGELL